MKICVETKSVYLELTCRDLKNIQFYTVLNNIGDNCFVTQKKFKNTQTGNTFKTIG
jgi:hypothetical protein